MLLFIEGLIPRRTTEVDQTNRWIGNIGLATFNYFLLPVYMAVLYKVLMLIQPDSSLVQYFKLSHIPTFVLVLLVMEFLSYWIHRLYHKVPFLWYIHAVHHTDTEPDVTTSHRHHPFEPLLNALLITPIVIAFDAPLVVIASYSLLATITSLISHSNISLPHKVDTVLRLFIVTPNFHCVHHSSDKSFTNTNYGVVLPWFDYLFRTYKSKQPNELRDMERGLEVLRKPRDSRLDKLFLTPFIYKK